MTSPFSPARGPRTWIGRWIRGVGLLQTALSVLIYQDRLGGIFADGVFNALASVPSRALAVWSVVAGVLLMLVGGLVERLEAVPERLPGWLGGTLLGMGVLGVALVPVSGFWRLLPPAVAALRHGRSDRP